MVFVKILVFLKVKYELNNEKFVLIRKYEKFFYQNMIDIDFELKNRE